MTYERPGKVWIGTMLSIFGIPKLELVKWRFISAVQGLVVFQGFTRSVGVFSGLFQMSSKS